MAMKPTNRFHAWARRKYGGYISRQFNRIYYEGADGKYLFETTSWLGVPALKCPLDLWIYQEILHETRPEIIIETGVWCGGSSLFLASICDLIGTGSILACDITLERVAERTRQHPRVRLIEGSSTDPQIAALITEACQHKRTMVILDSDHSKSHVLQELELYAPLVSEGCYLICEDTDVNGHPVCSGFGPGPYEAVTEFLQDNSAWRVDEHCERLLLTFNPGGFLLRVPDEGSRAHQTTKKLNEQTGASQ